MTQDEHENEQTKLLAAAVNTAATSCFTVGVATPIAAFLYNVSGIREHAEPYTAAGAVLAWITAAVGLHFQARAVLRRLK